MILGRSFATSPSPTAGRPRRGRSEMSRAALIGAIAVAGASLPAVALAGAPVPAIAWGDTCPPAPPDAGYGDDGQLCAMVQVPLDHRQPTGQQISIAVSMIPAAVPAQRRGVLFLNPGGPGGSGLDMPRIMTTLLAGAAQSVLDRYDLIGFDPRFVGRSTPASCGLTALQADQAFVPLEQDHDFGATTAFVQQVASACIRRMGSSVQFATTANTARDLDVIRRALGEPKINYFAWSYGTYLGAVYASLYPDRTDRVVLDSNVDPRWLWRTVFRKWGIGGQIRFPDFASFAAANDATYHFGSTPDEVTATYFELYDQADAHPFTGVLSDGTPVNGPIFRELTFGDLANDADFPALASLWQLAQSANGASARPTSAAPPTSASATSSAPPRTAAVLPRDIVVPDDNKAASAIAILCDDVRWSHSVSQYRQEYNADIQSFPMFGALGSNIYECAFWPYAPVEPPVAITASGPSNILLVQNLRDPNTPYEGGVEMHAALGQRSRLISVDEGGHAIYGLETNTCATSAVTAYLADGVFPAQDRSCTAEPSAAKADPRDAQRDPARDQVRKLLQRSRWPGRHLP